MEELVNCNYLFAICLAKERRTASIPLAFWGFFSHTTKRFNPVDNNSLQCAIMRCFLKAKCFNADGKQNLSSSSEPWNLSEIFLFSIFSFSSLSHTPVTKFLECTKQQASTTMLNKTEFTQLLGVAQTE